MRYLIDFFQFLTALLYLAIIGLLSSAVLLVIGYVVLQLIYMIGFLYKLYTYQL